MQCLRRLPFNHLSLVLFFLSCQFIIITTAAATAGDDDDEQLHKNDFGLAAYFPDYRFGDNGGNLNAAAPHLTDLLLFSIQPHKSGMVRGGVCCLQDQHYELAQNNRNSNSNSKNNANKEEADDDSSLQRIWVTIGGAGRAEAIPSITKSTTKRQRLIHAMVDLR